VAQCGLFAPNHGFSSRSNRAWQTLHGRSNVCAAVDAVWRLFEETCLEAVCHNRISSANGIASASSCFVESDNKNSFLLPIVSSFFLRIWLFRIMLQWERTLLLLLQLMPGLDLLEQFLRFTQIRNTTFSFRLLVPKLCCCILLLKMIACM
jgi:hypothetical protein